MYVAVRIYYTLATRNVYTTTYIRLNEEQTTIHSRARERERERERERARESESESESESVREID